MRSRLFSPRFPDDVPLLSGLLTALSLAGFIVMEALAEINAGRPSSTVGLGFVAGPIAGILAGAVVWGIAKPVALVIRRFWTGSLAVPAWLTLAVWLCTLAGIPANYYVSRAKVVAREYLRRPHVILDSTLIRPIAQPTTSLDARIEAPELVGGITNKIDAKPIQWNGRGVKVNNSSGRVVITDESDLTVTSTELGDFDYIGQIRAIPVCRQTDGRDLLAVLVTLRPTSRRSMLMIFSADAQLVYQHHLERGHGPLQDKLYVGRSNGVETVVVDDEGLVSGWTCTVGAAGQ